VDLLIAKEVNVNVKTLEGITPRHVVVVKSQTAVVERLIVAGANMTAKNNDDDTPLHIATVMRNKQMVELLKKHGTKE